MLEARDFFDIRFEFSSQRECRGGEEPFSEFQKVMGGYDSARERVADERRQVVDLIAHLSGDACGPNQNDGFGDLSDGRPRRMRSRYLAPVGEPLHNGELEIVVRLESEAQRRDSPGLAISAFSRSTFAHSLGSA